MHYKIIESAQNDHIKALQRLMSKPAEQKQQGLAVAEGLHLAQVMAERHTPIQALWVPYGLLEHPEWDAVERQLAPQVNLAYAVPDALYARLSGVQAPTGPLVVFEVPTPAGAVQLTHSALVLDRVQDPGNLGTLLRIAAAAGIEQVVTSAGCAWPWGDKVLRAGMGAQFALQVFDGQAEQLAQSILDGEKRAQVLATTLSARSKSLYSLDLKAPCIWVLGHEGQGVSPLWLDLADVHVKIPQTDWVESLNVAGSGAVCLFEQRRQQLQH